MCNWILTHISPMACACAIYERSHLQYDSDMRSFITCERMNSLKTNHPSILPFIQHFWCCASTEGCFVVCIVLNRYAYMPHTTLSFDQPNSDEVVASSLFIRDRRKNTAQTQTDTHIHTRTRKLPLQLWPDESGKYPHSFIQTST